MEGIFWLIAYSSLQKFNQKTIFISITVQTLLKNKSRIGIINGFLFGTKTFMVHEGHQAELEFHYLVIQLLKVWNKWQNMYKSQAMSENLDFK